MSDTLESLRAERNALDKCYPGELTAYPVYKWADLLARYDAALEAAERRPELVHYMQICEENDVLKSDVVALQDTVESLIHGVGYREGYGPIYRAPTVDEVACARRVLEETKHDR